MNASPDFETKSSYNIRVRTTDEGGLTFEKALTIGINDLNELNGNNTRDPLTGTAGNDYLVGGAGAKTITGGAGNDLFVYTSLRDVGQTITDFTVGEDKLVFTQLLTSIGYNGTNPIADGYVRFVQGSTANSTVLQIDRDGISGSAVFRNFITLDNITSTQLDNVTNFVF
nr:type I secretion C-terminal target domain-containing protein [Gloeotrichia echinulata DEX184]